MVARTPYADTPSVTQNQTQTTGTFATGPIVEAGFANWATGYINVSAASGTTHTLDAKLQYSNDMDTWSDIPGGAITQITGTVGSAICTGPVPGEYVQLLVTIGGTGTPSVTFSAALLVF